MAIGLTALAAGSQSPVLLGLIPGGGYLLGALMQRMVFPLQIAHCGFQGDEGELAADGSSLAERLVVSSMMVMSAPQEDALLGLLSTERVGRGMAVFQCDSFCRYWRNGFDRQLGCGDL